MRKLTAILLAVFMVLSLTVPAMANEGGDTVLSTAAPAKLEASDIVILYTTPTSTTP